LIVGVDTRPLVHVAVRFKVPVPVRGDTVIVAVAVAPALTVTVALPLPMRVGSELYAFTVTVQLPETSPVTVMELPLVLRLNVALLGPEPVTV
jgi:hypothetical protein